MVWHSVPATNFKIGIQVGIHRDRCSRKFDFIILSEALSWRYWAWIPMPINSNDLHAIGTHFSSSFASKSRMHDFFFEAQISRTKQWKDVFRVVIKMQNDRPYMADRLTIYESLNAWIWQHFGTHMPDAHYIWPHDVRSFCPNAAGWSERTRTQTQKTHHRYIWKIGSRLCCDWWIFRMIYFICGMLDVHFPVTAERMHEWMNEFWLHVSLVYVAQCIQRSEFSVQIVCCTMFTCCQQFRILQHAYIKKSR